MQEKENILRIFGGVKKAITGNDSTKLKELSDQTVHTASITQDPDNIAVAVIIYSLSKIIERKKYQEFQGWNKFYNTFISAVDNLIDAMRKNDDKKIKKDITLLRNAISGLSGKIKSYIYDVFRKAEINKASKIYEHGISMEQTANLLGISLFELASYAGQKPEISEAPFTKTMDVKSRIKIAMDLFK